MGCLESFLLCEHYMGVFFVFELVIGGFVVVLGGFIYVEGYEEVLGFLGVVLDVFLGCLEEDG